MRFEELAARYGANTASVVVEIDTAGSRRELSHAALAGLARERAAELASAGVQRGHVLGIRARSSLEWMVWDLAAVELGAVLQAFPDELSAEEPERLAERYGLALLITDDAAGNASDWQVATAGPAAGLKVRPSARRVVCDESADPEERDLHSLVYSSGTSGRLKGLRVSRAGTEYVIRRFIECFPIGANDRHLIFLPLANYQQRLSVYCCLWAGADLVLAPYQRVFGALAAERPTFVIGPPVFYDAALQLCGKTGGGHSLGEFLGGRIRFMITGMAPIRQATLDAYWAAGVRLLEAYGMTESGMIAWNTEAVGTHRPGTVGRLIDPESVEFLPDGELLIRRAAPLSRGYFEGEDEGPQTAQRTFQEDGSIRTGDYGRLDEDGFLTLVGRKKDLIALGSGRKVHPTEIEALFAEVPEVEELVVVPAGQGTRLGAIVTPRQPGDEAARSAIRAGIRRVNQGLEPFQRIASVVFAEQPLRSDPRFLTANLKLSRQAAAAFFDKGVPA